MRFIASAEEYEQRQDFYQAGVHFQHAAYEKDDPVLYMRARENFEKQDDIPSLELCLHIDERLKEDPQEHKARLLELYVKDEPDNARRVIELARQTSDADACWKAYLTSGNTSYIADNLGWKEFLPIAWNGIEALLSQPTNRWEEYLNLANILSDEMRGDSLIEQKRYLQRSSYLGQKKAQWYSGTGQWERLEATYLEMVNIFAQIGDEESLEQAQQAYERLVTQKAQMQAHHIAQTTRYEASLRRIQKGAQPILQCMEHFPAILKQCLTPLEK